VDGINLLFVGVLIDPVVNVFEIPVVDNGHQNSQTVVFSSPGKGSMLPGPRAALGSVRKFPLQAGVVDSSFRSHQLLPAMQTRGQFCDAQGGQEVIFIGEIACGPEESRGCRLGLGLGTELYFPLNAVIILHHELGRSSVQIFLDEGEGGGFGRMRPAARAVQ